MGSAAEGEWLRVGPRAAGSVSMAVEMRCIHCGLGFSGPTLKADLVQHVIAMHPPGAPKPAQQPQVPADHPAITQSSRSERCPFLSSGALDNSDMEAAWAKAEGGTIEAAPVAGGSAESQVSRIAQTNEAAPEP